MSKNTYDKLRPNILWYCTDQQRFDTIRALGNKYINTPRLDGFVRESTSFTNTYCQSPICTPSRASFLTGMYPSFLRNTRNGNAAFPNEAATRLVPRLLSESGYLCGLVGKLHLSGASKGREARADDGYSFFEYSHSPSNDLINHNDYWDWIACQSADPGKVLQRYDTEQFPRPIDDMIQGGLFEPSPELDNVPPELHQTTWCTEKSIDFIDQSNASGKPWMLSVNPFDPHPPHDAPWEFYRRYDPKTLPMPEVRDTDFETQHQLSSTGIQFQTEPRTPERWGFPETKASYYAMIELIDEQFGRLIDHIDKTGQSDNTLIIFTSDHGETLGDHGLCLKGCRFYDSLTRVPLIIRWPGKSKPDHRIDSLVELMDLAPTVLEAASVPIAPDTQGRTLTPLLTGAIEPEEHRHFVRSEFLGALSQGQQSRATMYRTQRWKIVTYHGYSTGELYDMQNDPGEFNNLWNEPNWAEVKLDLLNRSFDASMLAIDTGPNRVMPN